MAFFSDRHVLGRSREGRKTLGVESIVVKGLIAQERNDEENTAALACL